MVFWIKILSMDRQKEKKKKDCDKFFGLISIVSNGFITRQILARTAQLTAWSQIGLNGW